MHIDLRAATFLSAIQALLLAPALLAATRSGAGGEARVSLRIRGWALLAEGIGWLLFGLRDLVGDRWSTALASGFMVIGYTLTVRALRKLLGVPLHSVPTALAGAVGWLVVVWLTALPESHGLLALWGSVMAVFYLALMLLPLSRCLRRRGSVAERVLFVTLAVVLAMQLWRGREQWFGAVAVRAPLEPGLLNEVYLSLLSMRMLFVTVGFLLVYAETMQAELMRVARIDPLTGVKNRLGLDEGMRQLIGYSGRHGRPFAVLIIDADHFKAVNDRFGHAGGDRVLLELVDKIRGSLQSRDAVGRIGGEEFVVLAPDTDLATAAALGERLRAAVAASTLQFDGYPLALTVSIGVTVAVRGETDVEAILHRADRALYAAKRAGRDRVAFDTTALQPETSHG